VPDKEPRGRRKRPIGPRRWGRYLISPGDERVRDPFISNIAGQMARAGLVAGRDCVSLVLFFSHAERSALGIFDQAC